MVLKYETSVATLIQFVSLTLLNLINGAVASVQGCTDGTGDCVSNVILSLIYFLLIAGWFGFIWVLGYTAQDRRSRRLAQVLIVVESLVALVALFDARHYPNILGLITSLVDFALAIWVILLAYRLMRSGGGRIVSPATTRARRSKRR